MSTSGTENPGGQAGDDALAELAPSCKEAARLMSEARDRPLSKDEERSLNQHLGLCKNCVSFGKQLDFLAELANRYAAGRVGNKS